MKSIIQVTFFIANFCLVAITCAADLSAFPSYISFTPTRVGYARSQYVHVHNNSRTDVHNLRFMDYGDRSQFYVDDFSCYSLRAGSSCSIRIEYRPTKEGHHRLSLDSFGNHGSLRIDVSGQAVEN